MAEPEDRDPDAAMRQRLSDLSRDLSRSGGNPGAPTPAGASSSGMGQAVNLGVRVASEFVAAIVVGAFIGWQIDKWLGSSPAGLIIFLGLGTAAGFWNVYRIATKPGGK